MEAILNVMDVGGLRGQHTYKFQSGKINLIKSSNAGGKTSVIRSLCSILTLPADGAFDDYDTLNESYRLGIRTDPRNPNEGFVNIHAQKSIVNLEYADKIEQYIVNKDGSNVKLPSYGDKRFIFTGILSNESRIIRQLHGLETYEPDDFKWAVPLLSNDKGYDAFSEILKNIRENVQETQHRVINMIKQRKTLFEKQKVLEEKILELDVDLEKLRPLFSGMEPIIEERSVVSKSVDNLNIKIGGLKGEIQRISKNSLDIPKKRIDGLEKKRKKLKKDIEEIDIKKLEKEFKNKNPKYEKEIRKLQDARSENDGLLNIFLSANSGLSSQIELISIICPLCEDGKLKLKLMNDKIITLREKKKTLNDDILTYTEKKYNMERLINREKERLIKINDNLREIDTDIYNYQDFMREPEKQIRSLSTTIKAHEKNIVEKNKLLDELTKKISKSDEEINIEYSVKESERSNLSIELGKIHNQLGDISSVHILNVSMEPEIAIQSCEKIGSILHNLITNTENKAEKERREAANKFNKNINLLLNQLNFTDFKNVTLNKDYRLYVERINPETNDYVYQQPVTLSTSEKLAIALVLQLALKDTYIPNIPFFVLDDVMEDFDEDRRANVTAYLTEKARTEDIFIVITKLSEGIANPIIEYI